MTFKKEHLVLLLGFVMLFSSGAWATLITDDIVSEPKFFLNRYSFYLFFFLIGLIGLAFESIGKKRRVIKRFQVVLIFFIIFLLTFYLAARLYFMEFYWKFDVSFSGVLRVIELSGKDLLILCGGYILAHVPLGFWFHKCLEPKTVARGREGPND